MSVERPCILVGVTGCIAAYKAGEIVRGLQKAGVRVKVVMTEHGTHFVDPVTFRALTHEKVAVGLFDDPSDPIRHISLAQECDVFLIAPCTANVMAKVAGVVKTNTSVFPERRDDGWCARLETRMESVKVFGLVDIEVVAAGSVFLGTVHEPIKGTKNPQAMLNSGVAFTKKPKALRFDYKVKLAPEKDRIRSTGFSRKTTVAGQDSIAAILLLQKRWEDKDGNIYSKRVGTMVQRYTESSNGWVNDATYPILYGDITKHPEYKPYMRIQVEERYALNSQGKSVPIQEVGWAAEGELPTHIVLQFTSSHGGAYIGSPGNTMWIDNVELIY